jgi:hypothetical protein
MNITEQEVISRAKNCFKIRHHGSIRHLLREKYGITVTRNKNSLFNKDKTSPQSGTFTPSSSLGIIMGSRLTKSPHRHESSVNSITNSDGASIKLSVFKVG